MAEATFTPTQSEQDVAAQGLKIQAEAHGLDTDCPKMQAFLAHQADVLAHRSAEARFLQGIIHGRDFEETENKG